MDITPIYELKTRLRAAMIAGADLLSEDFRLKKAAENFAPLAGSSPVFAKINEMAGKLTNGGSSEELLDTITLVDAVITTLGTTEVKGDIEPLDVSETPSVTANAPYSRLSAVIDALTATGSGNYATFIDVRQNSPELLRDYRVIPALVKGLNASYAELAEEVCKTLLDMGKEVIPLLKIGFDPKGKKDMLRRVIVIEGLGGAEENDFYLEQLENAEKDVRKTLVYALRHDEGNADKLIELTKTEKGKIKDAAYFALAKFKCEKAESLFRELAEKKPEKALDYLGSDVIGEWQSELTAECINKLLVNGNGEPISLNEALAPTKKNQYGMLNEMHAITGKTGKAVEEIFRGIKPEFTKDLYVCARWLGNGILMTNDEGLRKLALELNANPKMKNSFIYAEMIVRLTSGEDCVDWLKKVLRKNKDDITISYTNDLSQNIGDALDAIRFNGDKYELVYNSYDTVTERHVGRYTLPVTADVKGGLTDAITDIFKNNWAARLLTKWVDDSDPVYCDKLADYFQEAACSSGSGWGFPMTGLIRSGRRNVKGLARKFIIRYKTLEYYIFKSFFDQMPGDNDYKLSEGREIVELIRSGKLKCKVNADDFSLYIEQNYH